MIISRIELAGFRGIREPVIIDLPSGFVVITGRNGSGKSSICDAIEFGLTGQFPGDTAAKEKGESWKDYIWWRGAGVAIKRYVSITFSRGNETSRFMRQWNAPGKEEGAEKLYDAATSPANPLQELCRTSINRDDTIGQLSLELPETERFAFVRGALGTTNLAVLEMRVADLQKLLEARKRAASDAYEAARAKVADVAVALSGAKAQAAKIEGAAEAEQVLRSETSLTSAPLGQVVQRAREAITRLLLEQRSLQDSAQRWATLQSRRADTQSAESVAKLTALRGALDEVTGELAALQKRGNELHAELKAVQGRSPFWSSLAELHQHGSRIGLQEGRCPLCNSELSEASYRSHLDTVRRVIDENSARLRALVARRTELRNREVKLQQKADGLNRQVTETNRAVTSLQDEESAILTQAHQVAGSDAGELTGGSLARLAKEREALSLRLQKSLATVEALRMVDRVASLEREREAASAAADLAEKELRRHETAVDKATKSLAAVRRTSGEIVDERLAELSPLFREMYARLRPHPEWQKVDYHVRGDVRRFLSLRVGDSLNPRFVFSSGQRRAAGLAFLLSVHLARPWSRMRTLVLDDPVQHIDDFRALHFVEVLTAMRKAGRQIVCTIEDESLADLLCRRLRALDAEGGVKITMAYGSGKGARIIRTERIIPHAPRVLVTG
jgi:DNA repair exonuclease SbcCD ATPase subunit